MAWTRNRAWARSLRTSGPLVRSLEMLQARSQHAARLRRVLGDAIEATLDDHLLDDLCGHRAPTTVTSGPLRTSARKLDPRRCHSARERTTGFTSRRNSF